MSRPCDLVLVGGGHAHVQVLRRLSMRPEPGVSLTVVVDRPVAVYSGMVPGFVAGQYTRSELELDVRPLALRARARMVVAACTGVDAAQPLDLVIANAGISGGTDKAGGGEDCRTAPGTSPNAGQPAPGSSAHPRPPGRAWS